MTTEKTQKSATPDPAIETTVAAPFGNIDWKGRPEMIAAMYGDMLSGAADLLHKQADLLTDLASCKDFSQALSIQTKFVQGLWSEAFRGTQKSFAVMGKSLTSQA